MRSLPSQVRTRYVSSLAHVQFSNTLRLRAWEKGSRLPVSCLSCEPLGRWTRQRTRYRNPSGTPSLGRRLLRSSTTAWSSSLRVTVRCLFWNLLNTVLNCNPLNNSNLLSWMQFPITFAAQFIFISSARLTLHSTKLCTKFELFRKGKNIFVLRLPLRHFYAFPKIWKSHVFRKSHKRNFELVDETLIFQGHLNVLWDPCMALLCSSRWSDQKCCKTECVTLKTSFQNRPMWDL